MRGLNQDRNIVAVESDAALLLDKAQAAALECAAKNRDRAAALAPVLKAVKCRSIAAFPSLSISR